MARVVLRKGAKLGSGAFSKVYSAIEFPTGRVVALKQARASLRIKRPLLQHESRVLELLSGHTAIPQVYAYGRIEHFEVMSMQRLHLTLRDVVDQDGPLSLDNVISVADQMFAVLEHLAVHNIAHRDIKPDNIMLPCSGSTQVYLIDFSLAYHVQESFRSSNATPSSDQPLGMTGTLPYASLNAHENKVKLTYRDDLESLAYTLLWLLRGNLPWTSYTLHGTKLGRLRQVYEQKKRHDGSALAVGFPVEFGVLVDYSRTLPITERPNYGDRQKEMQRLRTAHEDSFQSILGVRRTKDAILNPRPVSPLKIGQIVLVKIISSVTGEGYSIRAGHEKSYIHNPQFDHPEWSTQDRPCVITRADWDNRRNSYCFEALAIARREQSAGGFDGPSIQIIGEGSPSPSAVVATPDWPFMDAFCYTYKRPLRFHCLPDQAPVPSIWRIPALDIDTLTRALDPAPEIEPRPDLQYSPVDDIRHDERMRTGYVSIFAQAQPLTRAHISNDHIDWFFKRAWFDECVKVCRYNDLQNHCWWTGAKFPQHYIAAVGDLSESYMEPDFEEWQPVQEERDASITLAFRIEEGDENVEDRSASGLDQIISIET